MAMSHSSSEEPCPQAIENRKLALRQDGRIWGTCEGWLDVLRSALRMKQRLTPEELRRLAEAILDDGRMIVHERLS